MRTEDEGQMIAIWRVAAMEDGAALRSTDENPIFSKYR
jgi:hypothetical protein